MSRQGCLLSWKAAGEAERSEAAGAAMWRARCLGSGLGGSLLPSEAEGSKELNMGFNAYPFELKRGYENGPQNGVILPVVLLS